MTDKIQPTEGLPYPLGATWHGKGVNFALFSAHATRVEVCLYDDRGERETARVDLVLGVGQEKITITVTGDAPLLQTDSPQNNVEVSTSDMNELPLNIAGIGAVRDPMSFAALAPGTIVGGWNDIHISGSPATTYRWCRIIPPAAAERHNFRLILVPWNRGRKLPTS